MSQRLLPQLVFRPIRLMLLAVSGGRLVIWTIFWMSVVRQGHSLASSLRL
jgi:hypothetical protein